ncbi:MAG TPA: DUF2478 domain-containing protein [Xanthobacteraceae bacterium]|jgi:hypothetical protein
MFDAQCDLAALVYEAGQDPDRLLLAFATELQGQGLRPVGLVQRGHHDAGAAALPALLLHTDEEFDLFQDAAAYTAGRRLDVEKLAHARARMTAAVTEGADLLIVNRFGRQELEGRGLAQLIEHALGRDVPVVVPVPSFRFDDWIKYVEGMCVKLACERSSLDLWWARVTDRDGRTPTPVQHNVCEALK